MRKSIVLSALILAACGWAFAVPKLSIGQSYKTAGVVVTFVRVYFVKSQEGFEDPTNAIAIDVSLQNTTTEDIDYLPMYVWGALVDSDGNQIDQTRYLSAGNTQEFQGSCILAGARIQDTQTFRSFQGSAVSFAFRGKPHFAGATSFEFDFKLTDVQAQ